MRSAAESNARWCNGSARLKIAKKKKVSAKTGFISGQAMQVMVMIAGEVGGEILQVSGNFQQPVSELVGLRFGNNCVASSAGNPLGGAAFVRRFDWCGEHFHGKNTAPHGRGGNGVFYSL